MAPNIFIVPIMRIVSLTFLCTRVFLSSSAAAAADGKFESATIVLKIVNEFLRMGLRFTPVKSNRRFSLSEISVRVLPTLN